MGKRHKKIHEHRKCRPDDMTEHHRRPKRLGGRGLNGNKVYVLRCKHEAWHCLFDSLPVPEMREKLERYYDLFGTRDQMDGERLERIDNWIGIQESRGMRSKRNKFRKWKVLFWGKTLEQIIAEINRVWIDPRFALTAKMVEKVEITDIRID